MAVKRYRGDKAKADRLFSEIIRSVGYCEAVGFDGRPCSSQLQTAHICSRRHSATRTDVRNAFCLCFAHHRWFTDHPVQFSRFIRQSWAKDYYDLVYGKSTQRVRVDWGERVDFLMRIKQGEMTLDEARKIEE